MHLRWQLAADDALLDDLQPEGPARLRWWVPERHAVVLGFAQRTEAARLLDGERLAAAGVEVLERRAGGGLVYLAPGAMACLAVALPRGHARWCEDLTESYRWLGEALREGVAALGLRDARVVSVAEAREDAVRLRSNPDPAWALVRAGCFAGLSPYEVVDVRGRKVVGLAQVRRRAGALFQVGVLLEDQAPLADAFSTDGRTRETVRTAFAARTAGLRGHALAEPGMDAATFAAALASRVETALSGAAGPD